MILAKVIFDDNIRMLELFPSKEYACMGALEKDMRNNSNDFQKGVAYTLVENKPTLSISTREQIKIEKGEL